MPTCKNCISKDVCQYKAYQEAVASGKDTSKLICIDNNVACKFFKDNARMIELPCKVGDKLYRVVELLNGERFVVEGIAFEYTETFENVKANKRIYFWANGEEFIRRHYSIWLEISVFGKTVFPTREEAEKALAEKKRCNNA